MESISDWADLIAEKARIRVRTRRLLVLLANLGLHNKAFALRINDEKVGYIPGDLMLYRK